MSGSKFCGAHMYPTCQLLCLHWSRTHKEMTGIARKGSWLSIEQKWSFYPLYYFSKWFSHLVIFFQILIHSDKLLSTAHESVTNSTSGHFFFQIMHDLVYHQKFYLLWKLPFIVSFSISQKRIEILHLTTSGSLLSRTMRKIVYYLIFCSQLFLGHNQRNHIYRLGCRTFVVLSESIGNVK